MTFISMKTYLYIQTAASKESLEWIPAVLFAPTAGSELTSVRLN